MRYMSVMNANMATLIRWSERSASRTSSDRTRTQKCWRVLRKEPRCAGDLPDLLPLRCPNALPVFHAHPTSGSTNLISSPGNPFMRSLHSSVLMTLALSCLRVFGRPCTRARRLSSTVGISSTCSRDIFVGRDGICATCAIESRVSVPVSVPPEPVRETLAVNRRRDLWKASTRYAEKDPPLRSCVHVRLSSLVEK